MNSDRPNNNEKPPAHWGRWVGITAGVVSAGVAGYCALLIDDWSRDLSTNWAEFAGASSDPLLRPIATTATLGEIEKALRDMCQQQSEWEWSDAPIVACEECQPIMAYEQAWHLLHVTGLMGYRDDVAVFALRNENGYTLHATSQSRIGKGDLGQNPRNLRALHKELSQRLMKPLSPEGR